MKIKEILGVTEGKKLPLIGEDESIEAVGKKILRYPHTRLVYVVDKDSKCQGTISRGILIRRLFPHDFEPNLHARNLIPMIISEIAKDIMNKGLIYATNEE